MSTLDVTPQELDDAAGSWEKDLASSGADGLHLDLSGDIGDDTLAAAMADFAGTWESGAEQLTRATQGIADSLRSCATTYLVTDALQKVHLDTIVAPLQRAAGHLIGAVR